MSPISCPKCSGENIYSTEIRAHPKSGKRTKFFPSSSSGMSIFLLLYLTTPFIGGFLAHKYLGGNVALTICGALLAPFLLVIIAEVLDSPWERAPVGWENTCEKCGYKWQVMESELEPKDVELTQEEIASLVEGIRKISSPKKIESSKWIAMIAIAILGGLASVFIFNQYVPASQLNQTQNPRGVWFIEGFEFIWFSVLWGYFSYYYLIHDVGRRDGLTKGHIALVLWAIAGAISGGMWWLSIFFVKGLLGAGLGAAIALAIWYLITRSMKEKGQNPLKNTLRDSIALFVAVPTYHWLYENPIAIGIGNISTDGLPLWVLSSIGGVITGSIVLVLISKLIGDPIKIRNFFALTIVFIGAYIYFGAFFVGSTYIIKSTSQAPNIGSIYDTLAISSLISLCLRLIVVSEKCRNE